MILIDSKSEIKTTTNIDLSPSDKKTTLSFNDLLKNVNLKDHNNDDLKKNQDGVLILSLDDGKNNKKNDSKSNKKIDELLSLLQNENKNIKKDDILELNPKITKNLTSKDFKQLINDAKKYLKDQITQSDGYKRSQIKELPQTLKGLATLAKKFDIDISKITLEQVQRKNNVETKGIQETVLNKENTNAKDKINIDENNKFTNINEEAKIDKKSIKGFNNLSNNVEENEKRDIKIDNKADNKADIKIDQKINEKIQVDLKQTPIFKAHTKPEMVTTEQIVLAKQFQPQEAKSSKQRADDTLKLLLRGEKNSQSSKKLTADFSVSTAKVIAPEIKSEATTLTKVENNNSLESLLKGDSNNKNSDILVKTEQTGIYKADSFEVKLNEAKQMVKYLSADIKTAIDEYKSPFSRIKVQLNPQNLGAVDLTVVQRGKNLHINLSSNNAAINALALNINDLKVQLSNNGINNASFNFNSGSESFNSNSSNQQSFQNRAKEYKYFDNEEQNEEIIKSLEIIVPNYA